MKKLYRKKWFRRLCQTALVLISITALSFAIINWRGARQKRHAIARMETRGWPSDLSDVLGGLPSNSSNYAMIPILRDARLELEESDVLRQWREPEAGSARARLNGLFEEGFSALKRRGVDPKAGEPDFSKMPVAGPFGTTGASFLEEYDRRNGEALRELAAGLILPETRLPLGAGKGADWMSLTESFAISMRRVTDGLGLRAYAAMVTGDSAKAAETIAVILRLSEVAGSRNFPVSHAIQRVIIGTAAQRVKQGMRMQVWKEADLEVLRNSFAGIRSRERLKSCISLTGRVWFETWTRWEKNRSDLDQVSGLFAMDGAEFWPGSVGWLLPDGFFSSNASESAERWLAIDEVVHSSKAMAPWLLQAKAARGRNEARGVLDKFMHPAVDVAEVEMLLKWVVSQEVMVRQSIIACDLERHRLDNGSYPASLGELGIPVSNDPLHDSPFVYRKAGDFLVLYSVGPDGKDDGGVKVKRKGPYDQADWVW